MQKMSNRSINDLVERFRAAVQTGKSSLINYAEALACEMDQAELVRTARAYRTAAKRLVDFCGEDIRLDQINSTLMGDFQKHLKKEGLNMSTISFYMRTLRSIYNKALAEKIITERTVSPFSTTYTGVASAKKIALAPEMLVGLAALDPSVMLDPANPVAKKLKRPLQNALAIYLFCYHARGMRFYDVAFLKKTDIHGDTIRYSRRGTGQEIEVAVLEPMKRIIEWFEGQNEGGEYLFPIISDGGKNPVLQYESGLRLQNERMRRVAKILGGNEGFSTQGARFSWATVAKSAGMPTVLISEGLGHQTAKKTEEYLGSIERTALDEVSRFVSDVVAVGAAVPGIVPERRKRGRPKKHLSLTSDRMTKNFNTL